MKRNGLRALFVNFLMKLGDKIPIFRRIMDKEIEKATEPFEKLILSNIPDSGRRYSVIPAAGISKNEVRAMLRTRSSKEKAIWENGKFSGTVYHGGQDLCDLQGEALSLYSLSNLLHPGSFPCSRHMEAEVIVMVLNLFHGISNEVGYIGGCDYGFGWGWGMINGG